MNAAPLPDRTNIAARMAVVPTPGGGISDFFRHHGLWAPGVRLFRNIGFRAKAAIISAVFLVPIGVLGFSYFKTQGANIAFSAKERDGIVFAREVMPLLDLLQQQRAAVGQPAATLPALDREEKALAAVQAQLGDSLGTAAAWQAWQAGSQAVGAAGADVPAALSARNAQAQALIDLLGVSTDGSNLTLDPDIDTYYLMDVTMFRLPLMVEAAGRLQAAGQRILGAGSATPAELRQLVEQTTLLTTNLGAVRGGLDKAYAYNPAVRSTIDAAPALEKIQAFAAQLDDTLLRAEGPQGDAARHAAAARAAIDAMVVLNRNAIGELDRLIAVRVDGMVAARNFTSALVGLSLLLVLYLFMSFRKVLDGGLREVEHHIVAMRDGDLTSTPRAWGADEAARLMITLGQMQGSLRRIVSQVREASDQIVTASTQISSGAHDLSARTEQSAANLEETASAMEQIAATVRRGEEAVGEAKALAMSNAAQAEQGGRIVKDVVQTMQAINLSSSRIGDIIGTIDGIAFQTNILALNAAVEAARAGEQGRGFAVVATEVRALAQRSATAAREIKTLVGSSLKEAGAGVRVVQQAGEAIEAVVNSARQVDLLLAEVSTAAREQTTGVAESSKAVQVLDSATQQNAALVEQTAAAASSLKQQATDLAKEVAQFRLPAQAH